MMETEWEATKERLTLHGLGFIQVILEGNQRMHVWHPSLPRRTCYESSSVHDHRFGFTSRVVRGNLLNRVFNVISSNVHVATHTSYHHTGPRMLTGNRGWYPKDDVILQMAYEQEVRSGFEYFMQPYVFHESRPTNADGIAVTIMRKELECNWGATSLCKKGVKPDVNFDRKQWSQDKLATLVADVLKG